MNDLYKSQSHQDKNSSQTALEELRERLTNSIAKTEYRDERVQNRDMDASSEIMAERMHNVTEIPLSQQEPDSEPIEDVSVNEELTLERIKSTQTEKKVSNQA